MRNARPLDRPEAAGIRRVSLPLQWMGIWVTLLVLCVGCSKQASAPPSSPGAQQPYRIGKNWYTPIADANGFRQRGLASWYGRKFHGRKTASGETYNMHAKSAAHKTLPLGTWVRVRNLDNQKTLDVRINDRGPFVKGRIIDLSHQAAKILGVVGPGTAPVEIVALGRSAGAGPDQSGKRTYVPVAYTKGPFAIQVGAFRDRQNARKLRRQLDKRYKHAHVVEYDNGRDVFYRVRVGQCQTLKEALAYEQIMVQDGYPSAMIVAE